MELSTTSLYGLACQQYYPDNRPITKERRTTYVKHFQLALDWYRADVILERRTKPFNSVLLSHPPRHNPHEWRIAYCQNKPNCTVTLVILFNGSLEQPPYFINLDHRAFQDSLKYFQTNAQTGIPLEATWIQQVNMPLHFLPRHVWDPLYMHHQRGSWPNACNAWVRKKLRLMEQHEIQMMEPSERQRKYNNYHGIGSSPDNYQPIPEPPPPNNTSRQVAISPHSRPVSTKEKAWQETNQHQLTQTNTMVEDIPSNSLGFIA